MPRRPRPSKTRIDSIFSLSSTMLMASLAGMAKVSAGRPDSAGKLDGAAITALEKAIGSVVAGVTSWDLG